MKRTTRRLVLEKQTLRALSLADASQVRGGGKEEPSRWDEICTCNSRRTNCNPTME